MRSVPLRLAGPPARSPRGRFPSRGRRRPGSPGRHCFGYLPGAGCDAALTSDPRLRDPLRPRRWPGAVNDLLRDMRGVQDPQTARALEDPNLERPLGIEPNRKGKIFLAVATVQLALYQFPWLIILLLKCPHKRNINQET